jgi:hypothetical protein
MRTRLHTGNQLIGRSFKLMLVFASTVVPGFSLFEIHDQDLYSLLDMNVFPNGGLLFDEGGGGGRCFYVGATFDAPQFQHEYIRPVTASRLSLHSARYTEVSCQCRLAQQVMQLL